MGEYEHLQSNFAGGEISPRLLGRVDSDLYRKALAYCENYELTPQGTARLRGGSQLVGTLVTPAPSLPQAFRGIPFRLSTGEDLVVVLLDAGLQVWDRNGKRAIYSTAAGAAVGQELVSNSSFAQNGLGWTPIPGCVFLPWGEGIAAIGSYNIGGYGPFLQIGFDQGIVVGAGNYALKFTVAQLGTRPLDLVLSVGTAQGLSDVLSKEITAAGNYEFPLSNRPAGTLWLRFNGPAIAQTTNALISNPSLRQLLPGSALVGPWTSSQLPAVQWAEDSANNRIVLVHGNVTPQTLLLDANGYVAFGPSQFTNPPTDWQGTNWPSTVEIASGRLWFGATPDLPAQFWASRAGSYFDFSPYTATASGLPDGPAFGGGAMPGTDTVTAACAITEQLATRGRGAWIRGKRQIIMGTDLGEHAIFGNGGPIAPGNIDTTSESEWGSAPQRAIDIGDQVLYVSRDTRKVHAISYSFQESAWLSHDVTFVAEHLTAPGIKELHFARDPNRTIILVLQDGTWAACTYDKAEQVVAWWRGTTQGTVISAAVTHGTQGSDLWLIVERANGIFLEILPMNELSAGYSYVDSAVTLGVVQPAETVGGVFVAVGNGSVAALGQPAASIQAAELIPGPMGMMIPQPAITFPGPAPSGVSWAGHSIANSNWCAMAYGAGLYVAVGQTPSCATSPDGITWTTRTLGGGGIYQAIAFNGSLFVAANSAGVVATSPDGITWTTQSALSGTPNFRGIVWAQERGLFVAVSPSGSIWTSPSGLAWTKLGVLGYPYLCIAWSGTTFVVSLDTSGWCTSPDGITWTVHFDILNLAQCVAWNGSLFVAFPNSGTTVRTSPDGLTWTDHTLPVSGSFRTVTWNGAVFVALGGNVCVSSPDGATWTQQTIPSNGDGGYLAVTSSAARVVAPSIVVDGLGHLNGMKVKIILDGALEDDQVVQNGTITLARVGASVIVGLAQGRSGAGATATTLPPEGGVQGGTAQRYTRQVVMAALRLNESALPYVAAVGGSPVQIAPDRGALTPLDSPEPLYTGDVPFVGPPMTDGRGQIVISQPDPLRTEILGIFSKVSVEAT